MSKKTTRKRVSRKVPKKRVELRLPVSLYLRVNAAAESGDQSMCKVIVNILADHFRRIEPSQSTTRSSVQ